MSADARVDEGSTEVVHDLGGEVVMNTVDYTEPIYYRSSARVPTRPVRCTTYGCVGGERAPLVGDERPAPGTDAQLIVVDPAARVSYEFWRVAKDADGTVRLGPGGTVSAGSMSVVPLGGVNRSVDGKRLTTTGAGVSRLLGVVRAREVRAALIDPRTAIPHALSVSIPTMANCSDSFVPPATKTDGRAADGRCVKEGSRLVVDQDFACGSLVGPLAQAVCFAMQRHGAYDMDNGCSTVCVYAQQVASWSSGRADYAAAGVYSDYAGTGIPLDRIRVLRSWDGT
ncbi:hypothetical protein [Nocardioides korecus]